MLSPSFIIIVVKASIKLSLMSLFLTINFLLNHSWAAHSIGDIEPANPLFKTNWLLWCCLFNCVILSFKLSVVGNSLLTIALLVQCNTLYYKNFIYLKLQMLNCIFSTGGCLIINKTGSSMKILACNHAIASTRLYFFQTYNNDFFP